MNRRGFLRSLGIGVAAVYLRIAPEIARAVPQQFIDLDSWMERIFRVTTFAQPWILTDRKMADTLRQMMNGEEVPKSSVRYLDFSKVDISKWDATPPAGL